MFLCFPGLADLELLVVHPEGWNACPWSTAGGDMRDRDSKPLTSGKGSILAFWVLTSSLSWV